MYYIYNPYKETNHKNNPFKTMAKPITNLEAYINSLPDETEEIRIFLEEYDKNSLQLPKNILMRFHYLKDLEFTCILTIFPKIVNKLFPIYSLPDLPKTLETLYCSYIMITELPELPESLNGLYIHYTLLKKLPSVLPPQLKRLHCTYNKLIDLPKLPENLIQLNCENNKIKRLPELPNTLRVLDCAYNQLTYLPYLTNELRAITLIDNPLPFPMNMNRFISEDQICILRYHVNTLNKFRELYYTLKYKSKFRYLLWEKIREPKIRMKYHPDNLMKILEEHGEMELDELDTIMENW